MSGAALAGAPIQAPAQATDVPSARRLFQQLQQAAAAAGVVLRPPPPEPTSCCGRGCNGCVWEGFYAATAYWRQDALLSLHELLALDA